MGEETTKGKKERGSERINAAETGNNPGRQADGKFLPGHSLPGSGRKPKAVEKAYLQAVRNAVPPEEIETLLRDAIESAKSTRSWRGIVEVVQLVMAYGAGKPTQTLVTSDGNLDQLLAVLATDAPLLPPAAGDAVADAADAAGRGGGSAAGEL